MNYTVRVPQTSANLGAGFDTLGLALSVYNYFSVKVVESEILFFGCKDEFKNENNLLYTSMKYLFDKKGFKDNCGYEFTFKTNIKDCSGLGSSATCIVGGLLLGAKILEENQIEVTKEELVDIAIEIEGHGDNVVPALLGSLTIVMKDEDKQYYRKVSVSKEFKFATITSDLEKESTNKLREALKQEVSLSDATFNISHSLMTMYSLQNGDKDLLKASIKDRLHEDYRKKFIENFDGIKAKALELGAISLNISGSGPSLIVIYDENFLEEKFIEFLKSENNNWIFTQCDVDFGGASFA